MFYFSETKDFALLLMGILNVLYLCITVSGRVRYLGIPDTDAVAAGIRACRKYAGARLLCGCLAMLLYVLFCLADRSWLHLNSDIWSCTAAGTVLILAEKVHSFFNYTCIFEKNGYNE